MGRVDGRHSRVSQDDARAGRHFRTLFVRAIALAVGAVSFAARSIFVARALERAMHILTTNRAALEDGAQRLLVEETLVREQLPVVVIPTEPRGTAL